jgi:D-galactarolactone cycloisomerase
LKIKDIDVITLLYEYPSGKGFQFACGHCTGRLSSLIRVSTDAGIVGVGSVYSHPDLVRTIAEGVLGGMLVGCDPLEIEEIWQRCHNVTRWYGRKGAAISALGGLDTALWDIRGKVLGKPLYKLLGGERESVPAYASALLWKEDPKELGYEAERHLAEGFRAMKMRLGRNYEYDSAALHAVRQVIGPKNDLMIDGNSRYTLAQAERMAPEFLTQGVFWLEEPFPQEDVESYRELRPKLGVQLAAGENEFGLQGFRELINQHVVDIVQPDCSRAGGVTECRQIGELAAQNGLRVATHTWSDAVALVANMHVVASLPNGLMVEMDRTGNPLIDELLEEPVKVRDGQVALPQAPGLGVELNYEVLERYSLPPGTAIPDGNYSDVIFGRAFYEPAGPYDGTRETKPTIAQSGRAGS